MDEARLAEIEAQADGSCSGETVNVMPVVAGCEIGPAFDAMRSAIRTATTGRRVLAELDAIPVRHGGVARVVLRRMEDAEVLRRELDEARAAAELAEGTIAALRDKLGEMEAIIAGRTTPPTDAEIREHAERGGAWLVTLPPRAQVRMMPETRYTSDPVEVSRLWWSEGAWWVPVRYGRPCSWPTAEVPRG